MYTRIRKAREEAGYTREKFSELLGVSVSYMAEVERGRSTVSVKTLVAICKLLGLSADYLLFGQEQDPDPGSVRLNRLRQINPKYLPLVDSLLLELLALNQEDYSKNAGKCDM